MSVSDNDLETLEAWLDDQLPPEQGESLRRRLSVEPELAHAMDRLRSDRTLRTSIWTTMEPSNVQVDQLVANVRSSVRKQEVWSIRFRALRSVSAIAASFVLVFMTGWLSHGRVQVATPESPTSPQIAQTDTQPTIQAPGGDMRLVSTGDPQPAPQITPNLFQGPIDLSHLSRRRPTYKVLVIDPSDRIRFAQDIENGDDAARVAQMFMHFDPRLQQTAPQQPQQPQQPGSPVVNVNDQQKQK